ncbi:RTA1 like protein-domain-containing protein [Daldinia decipiens]|uniref:RTA1 like protein-domain-containing protein n=1 Tax=Daldinia decipiens TaxID=326647 RepID=UPI0020C581C7|nr:RTA1 like protein-domain-containing protein [Daldinia decipiens]KAI1653322.1 RTA1 like protein-domain-containing protein [Daldinia decipiens]
MGNPTDYVSGRCSQIFLIYKPSFAGSGVFLALFAVLIPITLALGIKYKSSVFATAVVTGLTLEVMGYIGRLLLHNTPTDRSGFILFLIGTIVGPTFICGSIFLIPPQIFTIYGEEFRSWRPVWYSFVLYVLTAVSLVLELAGVLVSTIQDGIGKVDIGSHVLVAGLVIQLVALVIFIGHAILFAIAVQTRHHMLDIKFASIYNSRSFKAFLFAFTFAVLLLVLRTAYRIAAIAEGFNSSIAQSETLLLILDGLMVLLATLILLAFFPGRILRDSGSQTLPRRSPRTPLQPIRVAPYDLPSTRSSPTYNRTSIKSSTPGYSLRKLAPPLLRNMVDSDALW